MAKADELGLEAFVEATNSGAGLYKAHGFIVTDEVQVDTKREGSSEEWKRLEKEIPVLIHIHVEAQGWKIREREDGNTVEAVNCNRCRI